MFFSLYDFALQFQTSAIDWSSTGGMLAVSRCAKEHTSWCEHSGCVLLHQINRYVNKGSCKLILKIV